MSSRSGDSKEKDRLSDSSVTYQSERSGSHKTLPYVGSKTDFGDSKSKKSEKSLILPTIKKRSSTVSENTIKVNDTIIHNKDNFCFRIDSTESCSKLKKEENIKFPKLKMSSSKDSANEKNLVKSNTVNKSDSSLTKKAEPSKLPVLMEKDLKVNDSEDESMHSSKETLISIYSDFDSAVESKKLPKLARQSYESGSIATSSVNLSDVGRNQAIFTETSEVRKETQEDENEKKPLTKRKKVKMKIKQQVTSLTSDLVDKLKDCIIPSDYLKLLKAEKKPVVNYKSYYSELLSFESEDDELRQESLHSAPLVRYCINWLTKTNNITSNVITMPDVSFKCVINPPDDFIHYGYVPLPAQAFYPKIQYIETDDPYSASRKLVIERKRREYASKHLPNILKNKYNIVDDKLIPPEGLQYISCGSRSYWTDNNLLPLEIFDDESYDVRSPEEWLNLGLINDICYPVPALAFICMFDEKKGNLLYSNSEKDANVENYEWREVAVVNYDKINGVYHVIPVKTVISKVFIVHRIYLYFLAEDPDVFAERVYNAVRNRNEAVNSIRFNLYVDCIPLSGGRSFDLNSLVRLQKLTFSSKKLIDVNKLMGKLKTEAVLLFLRHISECNLRREIEKNPKNYPFIKIPKNPDYWTKKVPQVGRIQTGMVDFQQNKAMWSWITMYVIPEVYSAMCYVELECLNLNKFSLFNIAYSKNLSLEEFESLQDHSLNNTIKHLQVAWVPNTAHAIKMCLRDVGKGWFNIMVSKWEIYEVAKLHKLMILIKLRMEAALRSLVQRSIISYTEFIEAPCLCTIGVSEEFVWGADLINSQFKTHPIPIFQLLLKMDSERAYYNTNVYLFEKMVESKGSLITKSVQKHTGRAKEKKIIVHAFDTAILFSHRIPQVHPLVLEKLAFSEDLILSSVGLIEELVSSLRKRLDLAIRSAIIPLIAYCHEYDRHSSLYALDVDEYIENFKAENHPANEVKEEIALQFRLKENLFQTLPMSIIIGPFLVNVDPLKQYLISKRHEMATKLLITFSQRMKANVEEAMQEYKNINMKLSEKPTSVEHIFELREWMETIPVTLKTQEDIVKRLMLEYEVLDSFWWALEQDEFDAKWEALIWPGRIYRKIDETNEMLDIEFENFYKLEIEDEFNLQERIDQLIIATHAIQKQTDMEKVHEIANDCRKTWKLVKEAQEFGLMLNRRQKLLGMAVTPFDGIKELIKEFEPYRNLWTTTSDWLRSLDAFTDNPLVNVDGESVDRIVTEYYKNIAKAVRTFADVPVAQAVALKIKKDIEDFKPYIPLIQAVRNPGLKKRHWEEFSAKTGCQITMTPNLTFNKCLQLGIEKHVDVMMELADHAGKEYVIELALDKMANEWANINLEVTPYKNTGTYIMKVTDEMLQMLDDHIITTQQLTFSPFKGAYEQRIQEWEDQLHLAQEILEEWMECQKQWMYLEPIFTSEDITKQLPQESKKFNMMERTWRRLMKLAFNNPNLMNICSDKRMLDSFKECNKLLELVQKGLSDYLEMKRSVFPRFYFLSDDELLEILSQARNPRAVQPHLKKCFENIYKLTFESDMKIIDMSSGDGECVKLMPSMYPEGGVEFWLLRVEDVMKNTVRMHLKLALNVIETDERVKWVLEWPGQVVIAGCQTYWTAHVENGIVTQTLNDYYNLMLSQSK
ncbi:sterile affecting ciliogenesis [Lycorma delicatula]|uniref:sterile affecting ciliogenesis n=1 Tax=Lycorma delicatula TaxID=130591 RepID=UPI003F515258